VTDSEIRQDIIGELEFDPSFNDEHIGIAVDNNAVSLSGHVNRYAQKVAAIAAETAGEPCASSRPSPVEEAALRWLAEALRVRRFDKDQF